jgi:WhiB family transcriptional regulator, redox-sensing transcriptional regulator
MTHYQGSVPAYEQAPDWRDRAACRAYSPELFFPVGNTGPALLQIAEAKQVCAYRCPVIDECLQWALDTDEGSGVWGGLSEDERRALKRRRARGLSDQPKDRPAAAATVQELWERHARPLGGGHFAWSGPTPGRTTEGTYTPMQAAFIIDRGHMPLSRLTRACEVKGCIRHVQDTGEARCSTRPDVATAAAG